MNRDQTAVEILAEIDRAAAAIQKTTGVSRAESRAAAWRARPELRPALRKAQKRDRDAGRELAAEIDQIVKRHALALSAESQHMAKTYATIRLELMGSAAGREIKKLRDDAAAGKVTRDSISKSSEHRDAWSILKSWDA